jgi:hypothetical protein
MSDIKIPFDNKPTKLVIKLSVARPQKIRLMVFNPNRPNTFYTNRVKTVQKTAEFEVRMPQNCIEVVVRILSVDGVSSEISVLSVDQKKLDQYSNCYSSSKVASFVKFAQEFCEPFFI